MKTIRMISFLVLLSLAGTVSAHSWYPHPHRYYQAEFVPQPVGYYCGPRVVFVEPRPVIVYSRPYYREHCCHSCYRRRW